MTREQRLEIFRKASLTRNFELFLIEEYKKGTYKFPIYLAAGQEFIPATLATFFEEKRPYLFQQHRNNHIYLSFGAPMSELIDEYLGRETGCVYGMGGAAGISSKHIGMFGHDGMIGDQAAVGVGACYASKKFTIVFLGDASAEEDYVMSSIAWAGFKRIPIMFVVEDNNLSILTEKKVRRSWECDEFARSVKVAGFNIEDSPTAIWNTLSSLNSNEPNLLNIRTTRKFWHAGAGCDNPNSFDRYQDEMDFLGTEAKNIHESTKIYVADLWEKHLKKQ